MFSKSCQYALQAVLYIQLHGNTSNPVKIKEISETQNIPMHFLGKILQALAKQKLLHSLKGPTGGFLLADGKENASLLEIVRIIDGMDMFERCGIGLKQCSDKSPCPIHEEYTVIRHRIKKLLEDKTIEELCQDVKEGKSIVHLIDET